MRSLKYKFLVLLLLLAGTLSMAQVPDWNVVPGKYQYSMTITAFLNMDGKELTGEQDMVTATIGDEVRGLASPIYVESVDRYLAYLTVYANKEGEPIRFSIYDNASKKVASVDTMLTFSIDVQHGDVFQAVSIASPALKNEAKILNFWFTGQDSVSTVFEDGKVEIMLEYNADLTALTPEFTISEGAQMYIDRSLQVSGEGTFDFSEPVYYSVLSANQAVLNIYEVVVSNQPISGEGFVCSTVITANNDGSNDTWVVQDPFIYKGYQFKIFDVNGRIIFESVGYDQEWDGTINGKQADRGKYFYQVENPESGEKYMGSIVVIY